MRCKPHFLKTRIPRAFFLMKARGFCSFSVCHCVCLRSACTNDQKSMMTHRNLKKRCPEALGANTKYFVLFLKKTGIRRQAEQNQQLPTKQSPHPANTADAAYGIFLIQNAGYKSCGVNGAIQELQYKKHKKENKEQRKEKRRCNRQKKPDSAGLFYLSISAISDATTPCFAASGNQSVFFYTVFNQRNALVLCITHIKSRPSLSNLYYFSTNPGKACSLQDYAEGA